MPRRLVALILATLPTAALAQKEFGFDNRKASGQPYLTPEESVKRMSVPPGFEVKLFAAEPLVVNPVAMTVDERGRVWVIECFEYPSKTPPGKMPRDRIVILEDTDGDGVADKRTVFAEGKDFPERFDLATGLEVGHGGVYVGAPPGLWFIENKDDKPGKFTKLLSGFGSQDTHETLNTFQWGPDGWLYGCQGVFTQSKIEGVSMNGAVWRYEPRSKKFEIYAEGTSNPWGMDFNGDGQAILACCVIPHLFHLTPGGVYKRQAGQSNNPYAYGFINEICDHTFHKESGWAHAGLICLDTPLMPEEYRTSVIFGSIHGNSLKRNVLKRNGSTYAASRADDFLKSGDKNFRPINLRWGPHGEILCIDWHDQNPCHQAAAGSWDYERGRVYRIQKVGHTRGSLPDFRAMSADQLTNLVTTRQVDRWLARTALRLLTERRPAEAMTAANVSTELTPAAVWAAHARNGDSARFEPSKLLERWPAASEAARVWLVRLFGTNPDTLARFATTSSAVVRLELAAAVLKLGAGADAVPTLHALMTHAEDASDPAIPQMIWLAYEPRLAKQSSAELQWLKNHAAGDALITNHILPRAMRRLIAADTPELRAACVAFVGSLVDAHARLKALEGLTEALKGRQADAPPNWKTFAAKVLESDDERARKLVRQLAVNFRDPEAAKRALAAAGDAAKSTADRAAAVRDLALLRPADAVPLLLNLFRSSPDLDLRQEACRSLGAFDRVDVKSVLAGWSAYPPPLRAEAINLLSGRKEWAKPLMDAVAAGTVERTELTGNVVLRLHSFKDKALSATVDRVWGKVRNSPAEMTAMIDASRIDLGQAPASFAHGRAVFETNCGKCHMFEGKGHNVGPALDGAGRDIEYLLINVIDPNRVVGDPYFIRRAVLKNGRVEEGMLHAQDDKAVTLKGENDALKVVNRMDIDELEVGDKSVMPEGLVKAMPVQDWRDVVRYVMMNPFVTEWTVAAPRRQAGAPAESSEYRRQSLSVFGRLVIPMSELETFHYMSAVVTAPAVTRTRLLLGGGDVMTVQINGKEVYRGRPGEGPAQPDQAGVDVELKSGENVILVEVRHRGPADGVYVRFHDADRKLSYPEPGAK